jgi:hypothetical protein
MSPATALAAGCSIIPTGRNKKPIIPTWKQFQTRHADGAEYAKWSKMNPPTWAIVTGAVSRRITLDFDGARGRETMGKLGLEPHRRSPSGGFHADFHHPGWHVATLNAKSKRELGARWPGLDIRADGGYVVFTGRTDRGEYTWLRGPEPYDLSLLPTDLREFLGLLHPSAATSEQKPNGAPHATLGGRVDPERLIRMALDRVASEGRNNAGFWLAAQLRDNSYAQPEAESVMRNYASRCPRTNTKGDREAYTASEIQATVREIYSRPARDPWHAEHKQRAADPPPAGAPEPVADNDTAFPESAWRGIFADYRDAMDGTTEASDTVHFATLWAALAAALGRKVFMYSGDITYPNIYVANVGVTGDKKTTGQRRICSCNLLGPDSGVQIIRNVGSTEGLADALKDSTGTYLFLWEEFSSLLARARWTGSTLLEFVTETFDCPDRWGIKYRKNAIDLEKPTPTILTATTVEWFWKYAKAEDFFGGFGNRFLFLSGAKKAPIPNPSSPASEPLARVKKQIEVFADRPVKRAEWTPGAKKVWDDFYIGWENRERKGLLGAALKRSHVYIRKLAMVYAAIEETLPEIHRDQLNAAIQVIEHAAGSTEQLIALQAAQSKPLGELEEIFLKWVSGHEGERVRRFQQLMWKHCGDSETFNRVVRNLVIADRVEIRDRRVFLSS